MIEIDAFIGGTSHNIKSETVSDLISQFADLITAEEQMIDVNLLSKLGFRQAGELWGLEMNGGWIHVVLNQVPIWMLFGEYIHGPENADELRTLIKTIGRKSQ